MVEYSDHGIGCESEKAQVVKKRENKQVVAGASDAKEDTPESSILGNMLSILTRRK